MIFSRLLSIFPEFIATTVFIAFLSQRGPPGILSPIHRHRAVALSRARAICDYEIAVRWLLRNSITQRRFSRIGSKSISCCLCSTRPCVIRINYFRCLICPHSSPSPPRMSRPSSSCSSRRQCRLPRRRSSPCSLLRAAAQAQPRLLPLLRSMIARTVWRPASDMHDLAIDAAVAAAATGARVNGDARARAVARHRDSAPPSAYIPIRGRGWGTSPGSTSRFDSFSPSSNTRAKSSIGTDGRANGGCVGFRWRRGSATVVLGSASPWFEQLPVARVDPSVGGRLRVACAGETGPGGDGGSTGSSGSPQQGARLERR
jgi:hypothetical protein